MASEDLQQNIAEKYEKTWNCPASLAISEALTMYPTNFLRPPFNSPVFLSFNFYFCHKTPWSKNIRKLGLNFLYVFFW